MILLHFLKCRNNNIRSEAVSAINQHQRALRSQESPGEKRAMALRQLYSAESTCSRVSLSTWSWNILTWSMKDTTRSADMGDEWKPAAANSGAMCSGKEDWAAFRIKSSLQLSLNRATC